MSTTNLQERIESGKPLLLAEMQTPPGWDPEPLRSAARCYARKVHALGIVNPREGLRMAGLAAASLVVSEGFDPILRLDTRDHNRIALAADALGARALGIRNLLCTTHLHQTLGECRQARNVFDLDPVQLLQMLGSLTAQADDRPGLLLGTTASCFADPLEMQIIRLEKAIAAGARFVLTDPVFDLDRFERWWDEVTRRGLHHKAAFVAGIQPLADAERAGALAESRPNPGVPQQVLQRISGKPDRASQQAAGIEVALETMQRLSGTQGLRGFSIRDDGNPQAAVAVIDNFGQKDH